MDPIYITKGQLTGILQALECRIMDTVQKQFDEVNAAYTQLVEETVHLQQQMEMSEETERLVTETESLAGRRG